MPKLTTLKCNSCEFSLKLSWGYEFVINDAGERLILPKYQSMRSFAFKVLTKDGHAPSKLRVPQGWQPRYSELSQDSGTSVSHNKFLESRIGSLTTMLCKSCLQVIFIDKEKDPLSCTHCASGEVTEIDHNVTEMSCPKCNTGQMLRHGRTILA